MWKYKLRYITYTAVGLALFFKLGLAGAAIITFDPLNPVYTVGEDPVTIKLIGQDFVADAGTGATQGSYGGGLDLAWDASILELAGVNRTVASGTFTPFAGDQLFASDGVIDNVAGTLTGLSVASFFSGTGLADFDIAELVFTFVNPGVTPTQVNISNIDVWTDGSHLVDVVPIGVGGSVTISAVPLPPAVLLFGSGLLGLISIGRRMSLATKLPN